MTTPPTNIPELLAWLEARDANRECVRIYLKGLPPVELKFAYARCGLIVFTHRQFAAPFAYDTLELGVPSFDARGFEWTKAGQPLRFDYLA